MNALTFSLPDYDCRQISEGLIQVITPFTLGGDTHAVTFFVEAHGDRLLLRDRGGAAFHASVHGCPLTAKRWKFLKGVMTGAARLGHDWELQAEVEDPSDLPFVAADMVSAALRLTTDEMLQKPKATRNFSMTVGELLEDFAGPRLKRGEKIVGASGHQLEIPFVIEAQVPRLIQPVAAQEGRTNWGGVYQTSGKFDDIKQAGPSATERYVILEDIQNELEQGSALTILSRTARVLPFSRVADWLPALAA